MTSYTLCVVPNWTKFCFCFLFLIHSSNSAYNCTEYLNNFSRVINYSSEFKQLSFSNQTYFNLTLNSCLLQECVYFFVIALLWFQGFLRREGIYHLNITFLLRVNISAGQKLYLGTFSENCVLIFLLIIIAEKLRRQEKNWDKNRFSCYMKEIS